MACTRWDSVIHLNSPRAPRSSVKSWVNSIRTVMLRFMTHSFVLLKISRCDTRSFGVKETSDQLTATRRHTCDTPKQKCTQLPLKCSLISKKKPSILHPTLMLRKMNRPIFLQDCQTFF